MVVCATLKPISLDELGERSPTFAQIRVVLPAAGWFATITGSPTVPAEPATYETPGGSSTR